MTLLIFLVVLVVLILVHEFGHFIVAKKSGIRVDEFAIGFPPKAFGKKIGETEYTVNWFPIGGFVKIWGEDPTQEHYEEGPDSERSFVKKPRFIQALVLVAGVAMNVFLAFVLYVCVYLIGMPTALEEGASVSTISDVRLLVTSVLPGSPAEAALRPGDEILSVRDGTEALEDVSPKRVADFIGSRGEREVMITLMRRGETVTDSVVPHVGVIADDPARAAAGFTMSFVGTEQMSLLPAIKAAFVRTYETTSDILIGLVSLAKGAIQGTASLSQVSGPVGIVSAVGDAAALGFTWLLTFTAFISLNLAVINLLPIPALDGGRLLFVIIESITRRPIKPAFAVRVNQVGFAALLILMAVVTVHDVFKLL